jgi:YidC/Oxa1 family membrane protein insertase
LEQAATATINATEPLSLSSEIMENALNHLPAALQYGDFAAMGLTGLTPAAIIQWSMELINVSTGIPWFWTIVAGSVFWRLILFPFIIAGLRNSAKLLPLQPQLLKAQEDLTKIQQKGDTLALQKQALKMKKMYEDAGVNLGTTFLSPFIQLPVTLGLFFGVKRMCELPVPQLTHSGLAILQDLTVPDPYMVLPIAFCAAINLQISVSSNCS